MPDTDKQEPSLMSKILRQELLILLVGLFFMGSSIYRGESMQFFWGIAISGGAIALYFVRKKDWKKHWEEQGEIKERLDAVRARERELKDGKNK